eukprot:TRINITY_DN603_c0_g1_i1.p1 TRINITY_DN603_c0_g1~~TRINITY_DN603_c0_g1_i1.p1  ORF type:complete len:274 (+),score=27.72 TRINITY_DN603_c0_g1_i1:27-848(+)
MSCKMAASKLVADAPFAAQCGETCTSTATTPSYGVTRPLKNQHMQSSFLGKWEQRASLRMVQMSSGSGWIHSSSLLAITAKTAGASKQYEAEVDKPLGLRLGSKPGGGVVITGVDGGGNAAKAGLKVGDHVIYTSSFFGDELWPADNLNFTKTAIQAKPDSVYFVVNREGEVNVKRLPKRPAPPRFGRKLTEAQKERATHICLDCGYIYTLSKLFEDQSDEFECPQCSAPKKRFAPFDPVSGTAQGGSTPVSVLLGVVAGAIAVGALAYVGLR